MHIEGDCVIHLVDEITRVSAARFVGKRVTTEKVWEDIRKCWSSVYTCMSYTIAVDEGTQHREIFEKLSTIFEFGVQKSGTEAQTYLSIRKRYHDPLRETFVKLREGYLNLNKDILFAISTKETNDTSGSE